jgi:hypothetical protein
MTRISFRTQIEEETVEILQSTGYSENKFLHLRKSSMLKGIRGRMGRFRNEHK